MKKESWKVFLACAIGAFIGSLVTLEVNRWFWWLGLITGGLTGYLSYEWKKVAQSIPAAYRTARGWQAPELYWRELWQAFLSALSFLSVAGSWVFLFVISLLILLEGVGAINIALLPLCSIFLIGIAFFTFFITLIWFNFDTGRKVGLREKDISRHKKLTVEFLAASPPVVFFWHIPRGLYWLIPRLPHVLAVTGKGLASAARFLGRFAWQVFIRIHSEMRVLCGVDAMIGTTVGYFAGSAIIGALAGGAFGVINYALVTERWLKPKGYLPARS